ncbi:MAG TPA: UDP-glucose 4-epimerase GalE [Planctomycetota bacterium]|nr:UDP-glucose 4-epimerase GalE [Planctomycetota bacterium]
MKAKRGWVLVTGGAGYVGSFTVRELVRRGERVVVYDDLSKGHRAAVPRGVPLVVGRVQDRAGLRRTLRARRFDAVLHFAAHAYVGESVRDPWKYWENNAAGTASLVAAALEAGVPGFVLSSTCAVYGEPRTKRILETAPRAPVNPYGRSKAASEAMLEDLASVGALRSFRLRYFNAAGAAEDGSLGEDHEPETHLLPLALRAAATGGTLRVFGDDYPTPDGTCVRDYVHVEDLARAHAAAVDRLRGGHRGGALNLGTGRGASVLQVVRAAEQVSGRPVRVVRTARRPGDPPYLVAAPGRARAVLGWTPRHLTVLTIAATAWEWHRARPQGFAR